MIRMMKLFIILACIYLFNCKAHPQDPTCDKVYEIVDEMPRYKNKASDLIAEVQSTLRFNGPCRVEDLKQITWVIDSHGNIVSVEVLGMLEDCKENIETQAKRFTNWTPGKLKGKPVCVRMVLPINIRLPR